MLAGNSNIISNSSSSSSSSHDPLRTSSAFCPQLGSAAAVATDHHSSQGTDVRPHGVNSDLQNDASLMLPLSPLTSSDLLSTTLNSTTPVTSSASCMSQPITGTTDLMLTTNRSSEDGLCAEDSEDCFLGTHHHCHGSISSSDSGVISSAGSQEEEMPLETSPSSSEQPVSCGSTLSMGNVGSGKYQISLAEVANNGKRDDDLKDKRYLRNSFHSVINPMNSSSSETSPVSWMQTSSTLTNANINVVSDRLSPLVNNSAVNANPYSFSKNITPINNNNNNNINPSSVGYLWQQFEKLMPRKHESVSATLHQYGIGKGAGLSHGMENSEEDQFWDIVQSRSFLNIA